MARLPCPFLGADVDLAPGRERHIAERHPDLLPAHQELIAATLAGPDEVRRSGRLGSARLFSRWYTGLAGGKHVVVVVMSGPGDGQRHWVVTAYIARKLAEGEPAWVRS